MKYRNYSVLIFFLVVSAFSTFASDLFDQGLKAANTKEYTKAISLFEKVIETEKGNVSAYFNLGNCYYNTKEYGKAILAYEHVLKYSPRDFEAPINIELCYKKLGSSITWEPHTNGIQRLIYSIGPNKWSYLTLFSSLLLSLSIIGFLRTKKSSWRRVTFFLVFGNALLVIICFIGASSASNYITSEKFALVTKKSIPTYMNELGEKAQLQIQEGTKVELIEAPKAMMDVRLQDGRTVLVDLKDIDII